ncbi:hypothetical protein GCM10010961_25130 [Pseudodonghicola xiamenensis]|uniref:Uncharacterized protein n=1 Tax=Pseudodonghicola xiamenensis TaxID=337702 RepID=A0A8J3MCP3_9RHOB|nr:hypothetical protein GCM10010961_25130 [Pseudodonghicola xiamenensis]
MPSPGEGYVAAARGDAEAFKLQAAYLGHGAAGAVEAWLRLPAPRDEEMLLTSIEAMYPAWLAPVMKGST